MMERRQIRKTGRRAITLLLCILLLCALSGTLSGCSQTDTAEEHSSVDADDPVRIGFSFDSFVIERWTRDRDVFVSTARSLGAEVNVQNANGDVSEQISQIEYLIKKNMDVIVIVAIDMEALADVVNRAREAGIKVVSYDRLLIDCGCDLYVSFDNVRVGELMGEALRDALPDGGKIFAIYGSQSDNNVSMVQEGFETSLEDSGLEIVYHDYCDNWLAELAWDAVNKGLQTEPEIDGIMCGNDDLASQAIKALAEHRLAGKVAVVAQDAELSACQRIVEGTQTMTVYKPVDELASAAAILSVALARGQDISEAPNSVTQTINNGSGEVPFYSIQPVAVTAENLDEVIIDSGFHLKEDVYLNVKK